MNRRVKPGGDEFWGGLSAAKATRLDRREGTGHGASRLYPPHARLIRNSAGLYRWR